MQGFEKGYSRFGYERELETEHKLWYFDPQTYGRQRCVFLVLQGCSTGCPGAHSAGWCLSLLHLISIFSGPQLIRSPSPFGLVWLSLPHLVCNSVRSSTQLAATQLARRTQLSYIIVRRPLDLWNRMFNRHQAEITVMQFAGHSLPVHQSMSVPWEFFSSSHFISQFPPTRFPLITAIGMCHFLPVHHLEWHFARAEGQNITIELTNKKKVRTLEEKRAHYLEMLYAETFIRVELKENIQIEHIRRTKKTTGIVNI